MPSLRISEQPQTGIFTPRVRRWLFAAVIVSALAVTTVVAGGRRLSPIIQKRLVRALQDAYASDVTLKHLDVQLFPWVHASGEGLVLRFHGRQDLPPLISLTRFTADASWIGLLQSPRRIGRVRIEGLQIHVPPRQSDGEGPQPATKKHENPAFIINEVNVDGTVLETLTSKPGKDPLRFDIHHLTLWDAGATTSMSFRASLTNAKPPGEIHSDGRFGPWNKDEPALTPVGGKYDFEKADLSVFRGIAGILSSEGSYRGVLEAITVRGTTDTPYFRLSISDNPVHLKTEFLAVVDGTDGDTRLEPVNAQFGNSSVTAYGTIEGKKGVKGKTIRLEVTVSRGRLEDMLRLGVRSKEAIVTGAIAFQAQLLLPPGDRDVIDKLHLEGQFKTVGAAFTKPDIQRKLNELSNRSRGEPEDTDQGRASSNFRGTFKLQDSVMTFNKLAFAVPGAELSLSGKYNLRQESMEFHGTARLQAELSKTTTGIKSFLLKAINPFFKGRRSGAVIPIKISGTKDSPKFELDLLHKGN